jgi:hypothetical protein
MSAWTDAVPQSSPMVKVTGTGFTVPVKLASCAAATNAYRKLPVGAISTSSLTPPITPWKTNIPCPISLKEPGGDGRGERADLERDRLGNGIYPVAGAPQGEARSSKASWFGFWSRSIASFALAQRAKRVRFSLKWSRFASPFQ